jgi:hypothetical protein
MRYCYNPSYVVNGNVLYRNLFNARIDVPECMVRRPTARRNSWTKYSLRKCIRPLVGDCSPGHDDDPRVLVLISRTVTIDLLWEQVLRHAV